MNPQNFHAINVAASGGDPTPNLSPDSGIREVAVTGLPEATSAPKSAPPPARWPDYWQVFSVSLFLAAAIWGVFGQTIHHEFINFDDNTYIYENTMVQQGVTVNGLCWALTTVHASNWHPLTWFSHMVDCQFYGLNAGGHHLTNILLHAATAILLFLVLRQMTGCRWRSALVTAVFAVHPLRVESVAWVAERKDVLCGLFFMLTLGAYVRYARRPWSLGRYSLVGFLLVLTLMSKPMAVTLPFLLLLLDYWPLGRFPRLDGHLLPWGLVLEKLPLVALAGATCVATIFAQQAALSSLPLSSRIGNAMVSYVLYLGQMIYPAGLAPFYPYPAGGVALWKMIAATILLLAISTVAVAARRKQPWLFVGWFWYLGMLVPVIGILQVGLQAHADRYTYLPQIGLYLALTWLAAEACAGWHRGRLVLGGTATLILAVLIFCAHAQTAYWRNSETLWTHTLTCTADNNTACVNLGNTLLQKGRAEAAILQFQRALQITDDADAHVSLGYALIQQGGMDAAMQQFQQALAIKPHYAEARNNLGDLLAQKGRVAEAVDQFQQALQAKPDYAEAHYNLANALLQQGNANAAITQFEQAIANKPNYAEASYNLGNTLFQKGERDAAIARYQQALRSRPDYANASYNLAQALVQAGRLDEAINQFQKVLNLKPAFAEAHYNLASALVQRGRVSEAISQYQLALQFKPDYPAAQNDLAWELATAPQASARNGSQAVALAQRANALTGGADLDTVGTLAAAYAEAGQFALAIQTARQALELARATGQSDQVVQLTSELKLYEADQPYHQAGN